MAQSNNLGQAGWILARRAALAVVLLLMGGSLLQGQQPAAQMPGTSLKVGNPAPDFTLPDQNGKSVKLSDFKEKKNVVLAFYVLAFTGG